MKNYSINTEKEEERNILKPNNQRNPFSFWVLFFPSVMTFSGWLMLHQATFCLATKKSFCKLSPCLCGWWQELGFSWWWLVPWGCSLCAEWCSDSPFSSGNIRSKCFLWSVSCARGCASLFQQLGFSPSLRSIWICKAVPWAWTLCATGDASFPSNLPLPS